MNADPEFAEAAAIGLAFLAAQKALPDGGLLQLSEVENPLYGGTYWTAWVAGVEDGHDVSFPQAALEALTRELEAKP